MQKRGCQSKTLGEPPSFSLGQIWDVSETLPLIHVVNRALSQLAACKTLATLGKSKIGRAAALAGPLRNPGSA